VVKAPTAKEMPPAIRTYARGRRLAGARPAPQPKTPSNRQAIPSRNGPISSRQSLPTAGKE